MYSKLWDLKNSIVEPLLLCGNRPCVEFLVGRLGLSIWWRYVIWWGHPGAALGRFFASLAVVGT